MIRSFGDRRTQALFEDRFVRDLQGVARPAKRKLELVNAAARLEDLSVPQQIAWKSYEETLRSSPQSGSTTNGDAYDVRVVDYH